jgi:hypothetical protein
VVVTASGNVPTLAGVLKLNSREPHQRHTPLQTKETLRGARTRARTHTHTHTHSEAREGGNRDMGDRDASHGDNFLSCITNRLSWGTFHSALLKWSPHVSNCSNALYWGSASERRTREGPDLGCLEASVLQHVINARIEADLRLHTAIAHCLLNGPCESLLDFCMERYMQFRSQSPVLPLA